MIVGSDERGHRLAACPRSSRADCRFSFMCRNGAGGRAPETGRFRTMAPRGSKRRSRARTVSIPDADDTGREVQAMSDILDRIRHELQDRLESTRAAAREHERVRAALEAL